MFIFTWLNVHLIYAWSVSYCTLSFSGEMGPDFSPKMAVKSLTSQQLVRIHQLLRQAKFDDPSGHVRMESLIFMPYLYISSHTFNYYYFWLYISYFVISCVLNTYFQCLSPAGEYNLRLGIIKELHPDMVATYSGRLWFNIKVLLHLFPTSVTSWNFCLS